VAWHDVVVLLMVSADPLRRRRPDECFAAEAEAARDLGVDVALVDHAAANQGDAAEAVRLMKTSSADAVHRGWMLRAEHYAALVFAVLIAIGDDDLISRWSGNGDDAREAAANVLWRLADQWPAPNGGKRWQVNPTASEGRFETAFVNGAF
jgi:hypothetical protein